MTEICETTVVKRILTKSSAYTHRVKFFYKKVKRSLSQDRWVTKQEYTRTFKSYDSPEIYRSFTVADDSFIYSYPASNCKLFIYRNVWKSARLYSYKDSSAYNQRYYLKKDTPIFWEKA